MRKKACMPYVPKKMRSKTPAKLMRLKKKAPGRLGKVASKKKNYI